MKPTNNEQGFTLIEVLFSFVILTTALVALAGMMGITLRMQMQGRNQTNATRLAQQKLDELVGVAQNNWGAASIAIGGNLATDTANYNDAPTPGFRRRWVVTAGPTDPSTQAGDLRIVTVRVIPNVRDSGTTATVNLTTMLRNPAP